MLRRRPVLVGLAAALSGCATANQGDPAEQDRRDEAASATESGGDGTEEVERPWLGDASDGQQASPHEPWPGVPDLVVLNHQRSSLTVYITVQEQPWSRPAFRETVSIRSRSRGGEALGVAIEDVPVVGATSSVQFETSWGRQASYEWDGGSERSGLRAHFYSDDVRFRTVGE